MTLNTYKEIEIIPIVLAGGTGTRLWPLSRQNYPKSLLKLMSNLTLLQAILSQIRAIPFLSEPLIVSNVEYGTAIVENVKAIKAKATVLLETQSLDTAIASAIAAQYVSRKSSNPLLLILPIDQYIADVKEFTKMLTSAARVALNEKLAIFGVKPNFAATDYGYIKKGSKLLKTSAYQVDTFHEKPDSKKAKEFIESGDYFWNSGIFLFSAAAFLEELALHSPDVFAASETAIKNIDRNKQTLLVNTHLIKNCPKISIDEALLQKTKRLVVFPFKGDWHDLGNWNALYDIAKKDKSGNVLSRNVITVNTHDCYLYSTSQLIVTSGVKNLLVVSTKDALLIASREKKQDIKKLLKYLIKKKHGEAMLSPIVYQTWGYYEVIDRFGIPLIKSYYILPGEEYTSKIKGRSSNCWLIVKGKAQLTIGNKVQSISKNQSIEISHGKKFKMKNCSKILLHFIEIISKNTLAKVN